MTEITGQKLINKKNRNIWASLLFVDIILSLGSNANFNHKHNSYIILNYDYDLGHKLKHFVLYVWRAALNFNTYVSIVWCSQCPCISRQGRQNLSRSSKEGLNKIMKTYTHTHVYAWTVSIWNFSHSSIHNG